MPVVPCGTVLDYLRSAYATKVWAKNPATGLDVQVDVTWFKAPSGALPAPFHHCYGSLNYGNRIPYSAHTGEVIGAARPWRNGRTPFGLLGSNYCGPAALWLGEPTLRTTPWPPGPYGQPSCCAVPDVPVIRLAGSADSVGPVTSCPYFPSGYWPSWEGTYTGFAGSCSINNGLWTYTQGFIPCQLGIVSGPTNGFMDIQPTQVRVIFGLFPAITATYTLPIGLFDGFGPNMLTLSTSTCGSGNAPPTIRIVPRGIPLHYSVSGSGHLNMVGAASTNYSPRTYSYTGSGALVLTGVAPYS